MHVVSCEPHVDAVMREWWNARVVFLSGEAEHAWPSASCEGPATVAESEERRGCSWSKRTWSTCAGTKDKPFNLGTVFTDGSIDEAVQDVTALAGAAGLYPIRPTVHVEECEMCGGMRPLACRAVCPRCGHRKDC